jgi:tetratricopeptide (TPR) repeat protein
MIDDLLNSAKRKRSDAQALRIKARDKTPGSVERDRLFAEASSEFEATIAALQRGLRALRRQEDEYSPDACRVLELLSQTCGSLGGTWRDAGNRETALVEYDRGNAYEEERRRNCRALDTYNMLQRLIVLLLLDPKKISEPSFVAELNTAREEIEKQLELGRNDSWALADLALARLLCGTEINAAIADLEKRQVEGNFYESTHNVIATLVAEGLGRGSDLGERLEMFRRLLQRKGGIPEPTTNHANAGR